MHTINDKSFEGEKFCGLLDSSGMWEKFHDFFHQLSLAYSEMDESTLLTHVCADFTLSRMTT